MNDTQRYGCGNCNRNNNPCRNGKRDCKLTICIAEHIAQDDKIGKFAEVLLAFDMVVVVQGSKGFQIVSIRK